MQPSSEEWIAQLLRHDAAYLAPGARVSSTTVERWAEMRVRDSHRLALCHSDWTLYQLIRSYGMWGGNAFLSVPYSFGVGEERGAGVLSVCTTGQVPDVTTVHKWALIAQSIFEPVMSESARLEMERASRAHTFSRVGHALKAATEITGWSSAIARLREAAATTEDESARKVMRDVTVTVSLFGFLQGLGSLLRLESLLARRSTDPEIEDKLRSQVRITSTLSDPAVAAQEYAEYILYAASAVARANGVSSIQYRWEQGSTWSVHHPMVDVLDNPKDKALPPFTRHADVPMALFAVVLEPLVNAGRYLAENSRLRKGTVAPLRLDVHASRDTGCGYDLRLLVGNLVSEVTQQFCARDGLYEAEELVRATQLASYGEPYTEPAPCESRELAMEVGWHWVPIYLKPFAVARRLAQPGIESR